MSVIAEAFEVCAGAAAAVVEIVDRWKLTGNDVILGSHQLISSIQDTIGA